MALLTLDDIVESIMQPILLSGYATWDIAPHRNVLSQ